MEAGMQEETMGLWDPRQFSDGDRLVTVKTVASILSIGRTKTFNLLNEGEFASVKIGRSRRISLRSVYEYIERLKREQNPNT